MRWVVVVAAPPGRPRRCGYSGPVDAAAIGVGMLGTAFMGKAHTLAYRMIPAVAPDLALRPELVAIAGRDPARTAAAAARYGYARAASGWEDLVADPAIGLFDNGGPNDLHAAPTIAAAEAGKHVVCEKPLGRDADESLEIWRRVAATGVVHLCAFNYRFVPAVRLARDMIAAGELGDLRHVRIRYLQSWGADPATHDRWRFDPAVAGSGALGDLASHAVDLVRFLAGEPAAVSAAARTFRPTDGRPAVDDAVAAVLELDGGAIGTLEATRFATGRINQLAWEINGDRGTLAFNLERLNELEVFEAGSRGFRTVVVSEPGDPHWDLWWPPGHGIGWDHTFVHELLHLLRAIAGETPVAPHGATFEDGYRAAVVCDAIRRSAETGVREPVAYAAA